MSGVSRADVESRWSRINDGLYARGPWAIVRTHADSKNRGNWRLANDGRHEGQYASLTDAKRRADWLDSQRGRR